MNRPLLSSEEQAQQPGRGFVRRNAAAAPHEAAGYSAIFQEGHPAEYAPPSSDGDGMDAEGVAQPTMEMTTPAATAPAVMSAGVGQAPPWAQYAQPPFPSSPGAPPPPSQQQPQQQLPAFLQVYA